jgi:hypothetical protein
LVFSLVFRWFSAVSPAPYAQSFPRKPSVLVLADFYPWISKSKQLLGFLGVVCMMKQGPNRKITFYLTLFYTRGLGIVVLHVMVPQPYGFSLGFFT